MEKNYKLVLRYDGTRYDGWQRQGNTENTIQGKLEAVFSRLADCPTEVAGAGRTDAGVHALAQVAHVHLDTEMSTGAIRSYANHYLPRILRLFRWKRPQIDFTAACGQKKRLIYTASRWEIEKMCLNGNTSMVWEKRWM